jgi:hypothetical protein
MDLKGKGWDGVDWINLPHDRNMQSYFYIPIQPHGMVLARGQLSIFHFIVSFA